MEISFYNSYDETMAFVSSALFYIALAMAIMAIVIASITIGLYGKKANKVGFEKLLRKLAIFLMNGSLLMAILPLIYIIEGTITFRSLFESCYIILTKVFTM